MPHNLFDQIHCEVKICYIILFVSHNKIIFNENGISSIRYPIYFGCLVGMHVLGKETNIIYICTYCSKCIKNAQLLQSGSFLHLHHFLSMLLCIFNTIPN